MPVNVRQPDSVVLRGRKVVGGVSAGAVVEGEALVTTETISGWGGIDPLTGTVIETLHQLCGQCFRDKVLVFPGAKGSSGWSAAFHLARLTGCAPVAMIFTAMTTKIALGAVVARIPSVTGLDRNPCEFIDTGDWVKVYADLGLVEVIRKQNCAWIEERKALRGGKDG